MKPQKVSLPYINNAGAVLLTLGVNLGVVFLFFWPGGVAFPDVLVDSLICAAITVIINMGIVYPKLNKMRAGGLMPALAPASSMMRRLPRNPISLGVIYALVFGALVVGINGLILWFFGMERMTFVPWLTYKLLYSTVLSIKIVEFIIFRYVQRDWAGAGRMEKEYTGKPVKNPLPKISLFKEMWGGVTMNIAMNIIIGSLLGGVILLPDAAVYILPTTAEGMPITGLVFGLIVGILVTNGCVKVMNGIILSSNAAAGGAIPDKRFAWMPKRKIPLTCLVCACAMAFSAVALTGLMRLFGLAVMNFYQFCIFITIYASLIGKPISYVLTRRCMQPDYIGYVLGKKHA